MNFSALLFSEHMIRSDIHTLITNDYAYQIKFDIIQLTNIVLEFSFTMY